MQDQRKTASEQENKLKIEDSNALKHCRLVTHHLSFGKWIDVDWPRLFQIYVKSLANTKRVQ